MQILLSLALTHLSFEYKDKVEIFLPKWYVYTKFAGAWLKQST